MNFDKTSLLHPNVDLFLTFDSSVLMFQHDLIHLASQALFQSITLPSKFKKICVKAQCYLSNNTFIIIIILGLIRACWKEAVLSLIYNCLQAGLFSIKPTNECSQK